MVISLSRLVHTSNHKRPIPLALSITIFEVFKWVLREHGEAQAIQAAAAMQCGKVVDQGSRLALAAAQLSHALQLPMADSIILATARVQQARLHTMDSDFRGIADVVWVDPIP
jgi:predicted nucleic acid-binding protein